MRKAAREQKNATSCHRVESASAWQVSGCNNAMAKSVIVNVDDMSDVRACVAFLMNNGFGLTHLNSLRWHNKTLPSGWLS